MAVYTRHINFELNAAPVRVVTEKWVRIWAQAFRLFVYKHFAGPFYAFYIESVLCPPQAKREQVNGRTTRAGDLASHENKWISESLAIRQGALVAKSWQLLDKFNWRAKFFQKSCKASEERKRQRNARKFFDLCVYYLSLGSTGIYYTGYLWCRWSARRSYCRNRAIPTTNRRDFKCTACLQRVIHKWLCTNWQAFTIAAIFIHNTHRDQRRLNCVRVAKCRY